MRQVLFTLSLMALVKSASASSVLLSVRDTDGQPLSQAGTEIYFLVTGRDQPVQATTDVRGQVRAEARSIFGFQIRVNKPGYYPADWKIEPVVERLERTVVLPAKRNPIPLFARRMGYWIKDEDVLPGENDWLGYDFEAGDWVAPHGKGRTTDIRFRYRHEFQGYRFETPAQLEEEIRINQEIAARDRIEWTEQRFKLLYGRWSGELEISFPGEKEGVVEVVDQFLPYSQLKMPHEAPVEGYGPAPKYALNNYSPSSLRTNVGFFLRTRVKLDERGGIVSANYAKVIGDFGFSAVGRLFFTYYFNPTANDRNLELDPERNLFPNAPPGAYIRDP
jgi:hypothetical protein